MNTIVVHTSILLDKPPVHERVAQGTLKARNLRILMIREQCYNPKRGATNLIKSHDNVSRTSVIQIQSDTVRLRAPQSLMPKAFSILMTRKTRFPAIITIPTPRKFPTGYRKSDIAPQSELLKSQLFHESCFLQCINLCYPSLSYQTCFPSFMRFVHHYRPSSARQSSSFFS